MTDTIKITSLSQIGTTIPGSTLTPVVDMSGTPTTKKATIANIANAILNNAGNGYAYAAKANLANKSTLLTNCVGSILYALVYFKSLRCFGNS